MMTRWQEEALIARIREIRAKIADEATRPGHRAYNGTAGGREEGEGAPLDGADRSASHENRTPAHLP